MISFISRFESISVVLPETKMFFWIAAFFTDAASVNPNGIKTLLVNDSSKFFIKGKVMFCSGPRSLPKNPPDCTILER